MEFNAYFLVFFSLLFMLQYSSCRITAPCSQTPYPQVCRHYINTNLLSTLDLSMDQAIEAHQLVLSLNLNSLDGDHTRAKGAWNDCLELYEDTVDKLNRSIGSTNTLDVIHVLICNLSQTTSRSQPTCPSCLATHYQYTSSGPNADMVVAQDGSGNYKSISEAVDAAYKLQGGATKRFVIHVKAGVYRENIEIKKTMKNIMFIGDGIDATIVTGNKNVPDGSTHIALPHLVCLRATGDGFIAQDMTFENTAGPQKYQAVALRSGSDIQSSTVAASRVTKTPYTCIPNANSTATATIRHDRLHLRRRHVVLQNCNIYARKPMSNQVNTVTAQSRTDPNENTGIVIHNSRITAAQDLRPVQGSFKTYLGRPWKQYSRTVIMKSNLDGLITPAGWYPWSGSFALSTLYYGEYMNSGAGAGTGGRVNWPGYRVITERWRPGSLRLGTFWPEIRGFGGPEFHLQLVYDNACMWLWREVV
ncbi:pectinesterase [Pyrus ussuriensis x Pyrus communis]|uniref:Pectinesterase n=1 Tax=Pyrus ussuriensis x Pyrus communis TaxID=2448454 RepID=A0A5N5GKU6_9ROSA|nr:pectinesterase [Pyrus ussuriensis x Pyrus communis]